VKQDDIEISDDAAISRLRPIQDGLDYWQEHRSSAATGLDGPVPSLISDNVLTQLGGALYEDFYRAISLVARAWCKRDCRVRRHASPQPGISDVAEGIPRGLSRVNAYLFISAWVVPRTTNY
jgi:hypothetical protein